MIIWSKRKKVSYFLVYSVRILFMNNQDKLLYLFTKSNKGIYNKQLQLYLSFTPIEQQLNNNWSAMTESSSYTSQSSVGWINWFCSLEDHAFFCKVDQDYICDNFNLYGIKQMFDHYNQALQMILRPEPPQDDDLEDQQYLAIYQQATDIYGLIHARFIATPKGQALMREKFMKGVFGVCPRVLCERQNVLPIGMSEQIRTSRVKVFCPRCQQVYVPKKKCHDIDGAYFGCSFPHTLIMNYPDLKPKPVESVYVPKVYGFKVYGKKGSKYEQKKQQKQITYYTQEQLKKIKNRNQKKEEQKPSKHRF